MTRSAIPSSFPQMLPGGRLKPFLEYSDLRFGYKAKTDTSIYPERTVRVPECKVHHPAIQSAIEVLEDVFRHISWRKPSLQKYTHGGHLRQVLLQVEPSGRVSLTLIVKYKTNKEIQALEDLLSLLSGQYVFHIDDYGDEWDDEWDVYVNPMECSESMVNGRAKIWHSLGYTKDVQNGIRTVYYETDRNGRSSFICDYLPGSSYVLAFYPADLIRRRENMQGLKVLAMDVARSIPGGSKICHFHAGNGMFGLCSLVHYGREDNDDAPLKWIRFLDSRMNFLESYMLNVESIPHETINDSDISDEQSSRSSDENCWDLFQFECCRDRLGEIQGRSFIPERMFWPPPLRREGDKVSYNVESVAESVQLGRTLGADVLIVDPPYRKGLEPHLMSELCKPYNQSQPIVESIDDPVLDAISLTPNPAVRDDLDIKMVNDVRTLVYLTGNLGTLKRDVRSLLHGQGGWYLQNATAYVMYPGTNRFEYLCVFRRF